MYTKTQPRATQLSMLKDLSKVIYSTTTSTNSAKSKTIEIKLIFNYNGNPVQYVIGGINPDKIPHYYLKICTTVFNVQWELAIILL